MLIKRERKIVEENILNPTAIVPMTKAYAYLLNDNRVSTALYGSIAPHGDDWHRLVIKGDFSDYEIGEIFEIKVCSFVVASKEYAIGRNPMVIATDVEDFNRWVDTYLLSTKGSIIEVTEELDGKTLNVTNIEVTPSEELDEFCMTVNDYLRCIDEESKIVYRGDYVKKHLSRKYDSHYLVYYRESGRFCEIFLYQKTLKGDISCRTLTFRLKEA